MGKFLILVFFLSIHVTCFGQLKVQQKLPEKTRVLFVLDGSGSMEALWGEESRMDIAKRILIKLVDSLKVNKDLELALRVYGHRYSRQANNCQDSFLEVPFGPRNHATIVSKIKDIKPKGTTPITYAMLQSAKDFPSDKGYRNILILITDGIESCGGDPCAASLELQKKGVFLKPFIIGLGIAGGKALECMGTYLESKNDKSFNEVLNETIETTFSKTTASVEILNGDGVAAETNINITFLNNVTGVAAYDFVHYLDNTGKPDTIEIEPVLSYDVLVHTMPPVRMENVAIRSGRHNPIKVKAPQGSLVVRSEGRGNNFSALVRVKDKDDLLNQQKSTESVRYLAGTYEIETLTFPRRKFTVVIEAEKVKTITIPKPGLLNLNTTATGYGSLFEINETGESIFVCRLDETTSLHSYNLLPGNYKVAFRVKKAAGSKYTAIKNFTIESEKTLNISMF